MKAKQEPLTPWKTIEKPSHEGVRVMIAGLVRYPPSDPELERMLEDVFRLTREKMGDQE